MKLLIMGGTVFVGRHIVASAIARGHEVTLFHRGNHNPGLFPQAEELIGDRNGDLAALEGRRFDAVIDSSGYTPAQVSAVAERLAGRLGRYVFISSISAYDAEGRRGLTEAGPLKAPADPGVSEVTPETYGPLKVAAEQALEARMPGRVLVVRPGLVAGPHDPTDRFTYWVDRIARGGEVLAPAPAEAPMQVIDARDLGDFTLHLLESGQTGPFNAVGPATPLTFGEFLAAVQRVTGSDATLRWASPEFLEAQGVRHMADLPFWVGEAGAGMLTIDATKAIAHGLKHRALDDTIRDTLAWLRAHPHALEAGLSAQREQEVLAALRN
jgi:2'-hydroxyisoflavone reductase